MTPLAEAWPHVVERARQHPTWVVATDFDGTLVPLADSPSDVALPADVRGALARLAARPGVTVAVVSGRRLHDLDRHVSVSGALLVANHGFEMRLPGGPAFGEETLEELAAAKAIIMALGLSPLAAVPGLRIEDKGPIVTIHLRLVAASRRADAVGAVRRLTASNASFTVVEGRDSVEVRPKRPVHKGSALCRARRALAVPADALWWYFGDDATDEDVFRTLPAGSVTVRVGEHHPSSAAQFVVDGPAVVPMILAALDDVAAARDLTAATRLVDGRRSPWLASDRPDLL